MDELIILIGSHKFAAVVSDNAANVKKAQGEISHRYPNIQNTRCIAHCINLITGDIVEPKFADKLLRRINILTSFFHNTSRTGKNKSLTFDFWYNLLIYILHCRLQTSGNDQGFGH